MKHFRLLKYEGTPKLVSDTLSKSFSPGVNQISEGLYISVTDLTEDEVKSIDNYNEGNKENAAKNN